MPTPLEPQGARLLSPVSRKPKRAQSARQALERWVRLELVSPRPGLALPLRDSEAAQQTQPDAPAPWALPQPALEQPVLLVMP